MNVIVITSVVVITTLLIGALLAVLVRGFSRAVTREQLAIEAERNSVNQSITLGHQIPSNADYADQLIAARELAAKMAARTPRGNNINIGKVGKEKQPTAFDGVKSDPITAVKIARFHGWEGLRTGATMLAPETTTIKAPAQAVASDKSADDLVPGVDFPFIEITEEMNPAEKRKARIANAKAKSAAMKTLKETSSPTPAAVTEGEQEPGQLPTEVVPSRVSSSPSPTGEPVPGVDYEVIEIREAMSPDEKRKARIANAKAKSAAMKAFKQAGGDTIIADPTVHEILVPETQPEKPDIELTSEISVDIPKPEFISITDDMDPGELRKARIHNAKAKSAYKKALIEAGIDPATVDI